MTTMNKHIQFTGSTYDWICQHRDFTGADCLIWPFNRVRNGYGQFQHEKKMQYAHRFMCELVNGPPPSPTHHASHKCGNGRGGCVHPMHLEWKTPSENHLERRRHGTAVTSRWGSRGKLSHEVVREIRGLQGTASNMALAKRFDVSVDTIRRVFTRESYSNVA